MYGIKLQDPVPHHLNSAGVWTSLQLPLASGDWKIFDSAQKAEKYARKFSPSRDYEIVELS